MQNKNIIVRVDKTLYNRVKDTAKTQGTTQSHVVREALQMYYNPIQEYNTDLITILKDQVKDLQEQRDMLQRRVDYYSQPWYRKILQPRLKAP